MASSKSFRKIFATHIEKNYLLWFPGHMGKGMVQMKRKLKDVDVVVEVHDARIPISGRNNVLEANLLGLRPHLLVLNKCDLIDTKMKTQIKESLKQKSNVSDIIFTDCRTPSGVGVNEVVPKVLEMMKGVNRFHRTEEKSYNLLCIGVPNVGKSSLINVLRNRHTSKKKATPVGAVAGITRSVLNKIIVCHYPQIFLYDTPGILEPNVKDVESALRLALCASMQDHLVGVTLIADYMLYWMNKFGHFRYVQVLNLDKPYDDVHLLLAAVAKTHNFYRNIKDPAQGLVMRPDFDRAASLMLSMFRKGKFGKFFLDCDLLDL